MARSKSVADILSLPKFKQQVLVQSEDLRRKRLYEGAPTAEGHLADMHDATNDWPGHERYQPPHSKLVGDRRHGIKPRTFITILQTRPKLETRENRLIDA